MSLVSRAVRDFGGLGYLALRMSDSEKSTFVFDDYEFRFIDYVFDRKPLFDVLSCDLDEKSCESYFGQTIDKIKYMSLEAMIGQCLFLWPTLGGEIRIFSDILEGTHVIFSPKTFDESKLIADGDSYWKRLNGEVENLRSAGADERYIKKIEYLSNFFRRDG